MSRELVWTDRGLKEASRLDLTTRRRIVDALERFAATDRGDIKKLMGQDSWRLRVGDWRVLLTISGGTIHVDRVRPRSSAYRN